MPYRCLVVVVAATLCSSCGDLQPLSMAALTCEDVEADVVALPNSDLIKIMKGREVSRSATELTCKGLGIYSFDMDGIETRYRSYIDAEGDWMVAFDTDEAQQAAYEEAVQEAEDELELARAEAEREFEAYMQSAQAAMRAAR